MAQPRWEDICNRVNDRFWTCSMKYSWVDWLYPCKCDGIFIFNSIYLLATLLWNTLIVSRRPLPLYITDGNPLPNFWALINAYCDLPASNWTPSGPRPPISKSACRAAVSARMSETAFCPMCPSPCSTERI